MTHISVTLWIVNMNKKAGNINGRQLRDRTNEILFGRLEFNLYGNVFLVATSEKASDKFETLLSKEVEKQSLSVEKGLTKPQKQKVIEVLKQGDVEFPKHPQKQSEDSYDLMRKFAIILLNDIMANRDSRVRKEFQKLMKPGDEEQIRIAFSERQQFMKDSDITVSVDLNLPFEQVAGQMDRIAESHFDDVKKYL